MWLAQDSRPANGNNEAYYWTPSDSVVGPAVGRRQPSEAFGVSVNQYGCYVVGHAGDEAFSYSPVEGAAGYGYIPDGSAYSNARAISADGTTVVGIRQDWYWTATRPTL